MLGGLIVILICQLAGEVVVQLLGMPVPGPVIGMVLLVGYLAARGGVDPGIKTVSDTLLRYLALLFVPAGVGLMVHFELVARDWIAIAAALFGSTVLALITTMLIMQFLTRRGEGE